MEDAEDKIQGGYYIKARKIQESEIAHAPPHVREIWDWLLWDANWKDNGKLKADPRFEDRIFAFEDLTEARRRILDAARNSPESEFCFTRDGIIQCKTRSGTFVKIEKSDDLMRLGVEELDYDKYYITR